MTTTTTGHRPRAQQTAPAVDLDAPLLDELIDRAASNLDSAAQRYQGEIDAPGLGQLRRSMLLAHAISRLQAALEPLKERILMLQNSPLGFLTDRDPSRPGKTGQSVQPYGWDIIRRCVVQALLGGFNLTGNEWNVIAGKFYGAKNGWERKLREVPGLTDLDVRPGIPTQHNGLTCVRVGASWRMEGRRQELIGADGQLGRVFAIITAGPSTPDTTVGKALAKAYRAIYQRVTGTRTTEADAEPEPADAPEPAPVDTTAAEARLEDERRQLTEELGQAIAVADTGNDLDDLRGQILGGSALLGKELVAALLGEVEQRRAELAAGAGGTGEEG